ncbi:MAG: hypothetical protein HY904_20395 [Deltaproteobacteria bacterium]|nr:hypothetical protein [Deltaproteobacteria bacterium]
MRFFNLTACPPGWSAHTAAEGRYLVGLPAAGTLAGTVGTALGNRENRPVGQHTHAVTDPGHTHTVSAFAPGGTCCPFSNICALSNVTTSRDTTGLTVNNAAAVAGTNAPYVQFLVCEKDWGARICVARRPATLMRWGAEG